MKRFKARLLAENEWNDLIAFAWPIAQKRERYYFPYFNSVEEMKEVFRCFFSQKGLYPIGLFDGKAIVAFLPMVYSVGELSGNWDKGIYIETDKISYEEAMTCFKSFLIDKFEMSGKKFYCTVREDYLDANNYFECENSVCIEEAYISNLTFSENINFLPDDQLKSIHNEIMYIDFKDQMNDSTLGDLEDAYFEYHDKAYPEYYWNAQRIKKCLKDFRIVAAYKEIESLKKVMVGSIFVREIDGRGDIYGLSALNAENHQREMIQENLLKTALANASLDKLKSIMFFCEDKCHYQLSLKNGFLPMGHYKVFHWEIL